MMAKYESTYRKLFVFVSLVVIDVSLLGGAKAKPSQGTNVCTFSLTSG